MTQQRAWSAIFLTPAMAVIGIFTLIPMILTVWISFHQWSMFTPITEMTWVGIDNFSTLLNSPARIQAVTNTVVYVVLSAAITIPLALLISLILYFPKIRLKGVV